MDIVTEGAKEVIFGGLAGLTAGYISKKVGSHLVGAALTSGFIVFRAAVYEGQYSATWSPLARNGMLVYILQSMGCRGEFKGFYIFYQRIMIDFTQE